MGIVATQSQSAAAAGRLALAGLGSLSGTSDAALVSSLPPVRVVGTVDASASVALASVLSIGSGGSGNAVGSVAVASTLPPLVSTLRVQALNVNTVYAVVSLPRLRSSGTASAVGSAEATGRLAIGAPGSTNASQAAQGTAALSLRSVGVLTGHATAYVSASLDLATSISVQPPPSGYTPDGDYYIALAARPFYASLAHRPFYAKAPARSFYTLSDPDMTPTFDTLDPRETLVLTLDASADLDSGETLTDISEVTAVQQAGLASTPPALTGEVINAQTLSLTVAGKPVTIDVGHAVQVIASGGTTGCRYLVAATCKTSNPDKVLTLKGVLPVSAQ